MIEIEATLNICPDCYIWTHYRWDEIDNYPPEWEGPTHSAVRRCVTSEYDCDCDWEIGDCDGHWAFSTSPCQGCGDGLAGDRAAVRIWTRSRKEN